MQAQKTKMNSPRRQINNRPFDKDPPQQVDFSIFRRKNSQSYTSSQATITALRTNNYSITAVLSGIHLIYLNSPVESQLFKEIDLTNADRSFAQYLNEKTMMEFWRVFKDKIGSLAALADILNHYPIATFFLDVYARQQAIFYLQNPTETEEENMMGNEFQILNDCSCQPRGNAFDLLIKSLKLSLSVKHNRSDNVKFVRKMATNEIDQCYGNEDYCASIQIKNDAKDITYAITEQKTYIPVIKKSKGQFLQRKSRAREIESGRTSTQSRSLRKDKFCDHCGKMRCLCKNEQASQYSNAINLSKSISGGFAQYSSKSEPNTGIPRFNSLGMGFINVNKIVNRDFYRKS